jgi:hypothetical protein
MNAIVTYTTSGSGGRIIIKAGAPLGTSAATNDGTEGVPGSRAFDALAVEL